MNKKVKLAIEVLVMLVLLVLCSPFFGLLHSKLVTNAGGSFIGDTISWNFIFGFFMSYAFFVTLFLTIFGGKRKYWAIIILVGLELLFFFGAWQSVIIDLVTAIIGWLIGEVVLLIYKNRGKK